jgi:3-oxoacyl-[acyl-carrier protein] reductase
MPPVVLITGATEGIGRATAFAFGRDGWRVGVCARTAGKVAALVEALRADGITAAGVAGDVGIPGDVERVVRALAAELGPVDVLVNNAGIAVFKPFEEQTLEEWDGMMATNVRSLFLVTRAVLPGMRERGAGTIVNVASLAGRNGVKHGTGYAASKHAVLGFSRSLMLEVRAQGVRVVAVCPGSVDTELLRPLGRDAGRILQPSDVADAILAAVRLPARAMVSELDIRPSNP